MNWTREPLVHFLVLCAQLFGLFALLNDKETFDVAQNGETRNQ